RGGRFLAQQQVRADPCRAEHEQQDDDPDRRQFPRRRLLRGFRFLFDDDHEGSGTPFGGAVPRPPQGPRGGVAWGFCVFSSRRTGGGGGRPWGGPPPAYSAPRSEDLNAG